MKVKLGIICTFILLLMISCKAQHPSYKSVKREMQVYEVPDNRAVIVIDTRLPRQDNENIFETIIYRSTDMGKSWQRISESELNAYYNKFPGKSYLGRHPANPKYVYAIAGQGNLPKPEHMEISKDGGLSWQSARAQIIDTTATLGYFDTINLHPRELDTIYVAGRIIGNINVPELHGLYVSHDYGSTFSLIMACNNVVQFDISHSDPNIMYCNIFHGFLSKSVDSGKSWMLVGPFYNNIENINNDRMYGRNNWQDNNNHGISAIKIHPFKSDIVYALIDNGVWITNDSSHTWRLIKPIERNDLDTYSMVSLINSKEETLLIACNYGLYASHDQGKTWSEIALPLYKR